VSKDGAKKGHRAWKEGGPGKTGDVSRNLKNNRRRGGRIKRQVELRPSDKQILFLGRLKKYSEKPKKPIRGGFKESTKLGENNSKSTCEAGRGDNT